jgi:hypothetical protein
MQVEFASVYWKGHWCGVHRDLLKTPSHDQLVLRACEKYLNSFEYQNTYKMKK